MFSVKVNTKKSFEIEGNTVNQSQEIFDIIQVKEGEMHIIWNHTSYTAILVEANTEEKSFIIRVNGSEYDVKVQDKFDLLLQQLGMGNLKTTKVNNIKAPMPGLVLQVLVNAGDTVNKGDKILVLEAMKMENAIKSPTDGIVNDVLVSQGMAVDKNQVLITFK